MSNTRAGSALRAIAIGTVILASGACDLSPAFDPGCIDLFGSGGACGGQPGGGGVTTSPFRLVGSQNVLVGDTVRIRPDSTPNGSAIHWTISGPGQIVSADSGANGHLLVRGTGPGGVTVSATASCCAQTVWTSFQVAREITVRAIRYGTDTMSVRVGELRDLRGAVVDDVGRQYRVPFSWTSRDTSVAGVVHDPSDAALGWTTRGLAAGSVHIVIAALGTRDSVLVIVVP
jgi:hypothetical protein